MLETTAPASGHLRLIVDAFLQFLDLPEQLPDHALHGSCDHGHVRLFMIAW